MVTKIQAWGNSQGVRLPKALLAEAGVQVGDDVDVLVKDGAIVLVPARRVRGAVPLRDLVRRMPRDHAPAEADWGPPVGREDW